MKKLFFLLFFLSFFAFAHLARAGNISTSTNNHWAWTDSIGWIQFNDNGNNMTPNVGSSGLTGYATSSMGDFSLNCSSYRVKSQGATTTVCASTPYQVLNNGGGYLSGWAWNDSIGWISFCGGASSASCPGTVNYQVTIDSSGNFHGYAWNSSIGWMSFNCLEPGLCASYNYKVNTTWVATSTYGYLESSTFDLGANGGQPNTVMWHGSLPAGTRVGFQFAASSTNGAWSDTDFHGPTGLSNNVSDLYDPGAPNTELDIMGTSASTTRFTNLRYFRYRVYLISDITQIYTPRVDDIEVNWSP